MSLTQFYNGRMIMDYSGKLAPVRMRIDSDQSEAASAALSNLCNILSLGKQIVETGEYTDYQIVTAFPDNSAINYNVYRLTLVDNIDSSVKEYMYIPSANLGLLSDNLDYIPDTSSTFTQIASYVQPYYRSRLGNGCTLTAIEYVNQRNTIFPSQVGTATFAPQQVKTTNISENGQYIVNPDSGYIIGRNIINVNVPNTPSQSKSATYTSNGNYTIYPDSGYLLDSAAITVNVASSSGTFNRIGLYGLEVYINSTNFTKATSEVTVSYISSTTRVAVFFQIMPSQNYIRMIYIILNKGIGFTLYGSESSPVYYYVRDYDSFAYTCSLMLNNYKLLGVQTYSSSSGIIGECWLYPRLLKYAGTWW